MCGPRSSGRGARFRTPLTMVMRVFGGMTYTWPGSTRTPCVTSTTGIRVVLDRISLKMLGDFGSRCWTSTKAIVASSDRCASNSENASSPPAEAPMPTIGKLSLDGLGAATLPRVGKAALCSRVALLIGEAGPRGSAPRLREAEREPGDDLFIATLRVRRPARSNAIVAPASGCDNGAMGMSSLRSLALDACLPLLGPRARSNGGTFHACARGRSPGCHFLRTPTARPHPAVG